MQNFRNITCWENSRRLQKLSLFRELTKLYHDSLEPTSLGTYESEASEPITTQMNFITQEVISIVHAAQVSTHVYRDRDLIEVISNVFSLGDLNIPRQNVINAIERAMGVYRSNWSKSVIRTCNPLWWAGRLIDWIAYTPFRLIGAAGFDSANAAESILGRLIILFLKITVTLIGTTGALIAIDERFGVWDTVTPIFWPH